MQIFAPDTDITLTFDMIAPDGTTAISPTAAVFSVYDEDGNSLVVNEAVTVSGGESALNVTVLAVNNASAGARQVNLSVNAVEGAFTLQETYVLETGDLLQIPSQSAMTVPASLLVRRNMASSSLVEWDYATVDQRRAALAEAWTRISKLCFYPWLSYETPNENLPDAVIEGDFLVRELSFENWGYLPSHFTDALKRAQLLEACSILEGESAFERRRDGLLSKTVGESSEMFSTGGVAMKSITPATKRELSKYLVRRVEIGRA